MKHIRSDYDKTIRKAMIEQDVDRNELSDYCGYSDGCNIMQSIKTGSLGDQFHVDLCKILKLDLGELLLLKLKARYESSK